MGYQDRELLRAFQDNTIVRLMSQTKPLVAAGVMMLIERGQLSLDDPLWKYHGGFRCVHACFQGRSNILYHTYMKGSSSWSHSIL